MIRLNFIFLFGEITSVSLFSFSKFIIIVTVYKCLQFYFFLFSCTVLLKILYLYELCCFLLLVRAIALDDGNAHLLELRIRFQEKNL